MKYICITNYIHSFPIKKYTKTTLIAKNNWPSVKTIINPRHQLSVYLFFDSKPYLGRSKKSTNQGRELQVKRTFFKKNQPGSAWNFPEPLVLVCSRCFNSLPSHFKINVSLFCCSLFFNSQALSFRIILKDTSSNILYTPLGFRFSISFIKFSHKPVYPIMVVKNIQIYGVQITGEWICKSKNWK